MDMATAMDMVIATALGHDVIAERVTDRAKPRRWQKKRDRASCAVPFLFWLRDDRRDLPPVVRR